MIELFRNLFTPPRHIILLAGALWIGLTLSEKRAARHKVNGQALNDLVFYALMAFVAGGRILFAVAHLEAFAKSPLSLFALNPDLFDPLGGLTAAFITALVYGQRKGLAFWSTLDALTPFFATMMVGLGASHLASGDAFGKETSLPWGIELLGATRHPSQIYEVAAALFILNLIGLRKPFPAAGAQFLAFVAWTAGASLFLEAFRGDSTLVFGGLRLGQIFAWIVLAAALVGLERLQSGMVVNEQA